MIFSSKFTISDMPKTGSTFILDKIHDNFCVVKRHWPDRYHMGKDVADDIFSVYREPIDWYASWASFVMNGSDMYPSSEFRFSRIKELFIDHGVNMTPDNIAKYFLGMFPELKDKIHLYRPIVNVDPFRIRQWQNSHLDIYSFWCETYLKGTTRMRFTDLNEDFSLVLRKYSMHCLADAVADSPKINITKDKCSLSDETINLINTRCSDAINKYKVTSFDI